MIRFLFCLIFFFIGNNISGQSPTAVNKTKEQYVIKGRVYDSSLKINLTEVSVYVKHHEKYGCVARNGYFELKLPNIYRKKNFSLIIACLTYDPYQAKIKNKKETFEEELIIYLQQHVIDKNDIIIVGKKSD